MNNEFEKIYKEAHVKREKSIARKSELEGELLQVNGKIDALEEEISKAKYLNKNAAKESEAQDLLLRERKVIQAAIEFCERDIASIKQDLESAARSIFFEERNSFAVNLILFSDKAKDLCNEFGPIIQGWENLLQLSGRAGIGWGQTDFPYIHRHVYNSLFSFFNPNLLPYELKNAEENFPEFYKIGRAGIKKEVKK